MTTDPTHCLAGTTGESGIHPYSLQNTVHAFGPPTTVTKGEL